MHRPLPHRRPFLLLKNCLCGNCRPMQNIQSPNPAVPATQTLEAQPPGTSVEPYSSDNQTNDGHIGQPAWFDLQSSEPLCQPVSVDESSRGTTSPNYIGNELLVTTCSSFPPVAQSPSCEPSAVDARPPLQPSLVTSHAPIEQSSSNVSMSPSHATPVKFVFKPTDVARPAEFSDTSKRFDVIVSNDISWSTVAWKSVDVYNKSRFL